MKKERLRATFSVKGIGIQLSELREPDPILTLTGGQI